MQDASSFRNSIRYSVSLAAVAALLAVMASAPVLAQNTVPATALEAAASPAFASKLHPSTPSAAASRGRASARACSRRVSRQPGTLNYENGPVNGTTDAWTINFGYIVSDSFVPSGSTVSGFGLYIWEFPGATLSSLQWSITSSPNGGTVYGSGTISDGNLIDTFISTNQYGYNIDGISASGLNVKVTPGSTYWVNLFNAAVPSGDPVYWDENSGKGCNSPGCPSQAYQSAVGTIASEAFDITGGGTNNFPCFEAGGKLAVIHDFTGKGDGAYPEGLTMDKTGKFYGGTWGGGDNGYGEVYKLALKNQDWTLTPLYNFPGDLSLLEPNALIVGPEAALYGSASCSYGGCSLVYSLRPSPSACLTALCSWTESELYRIPQFGFPPPTGLVFDPGGNLYGVLTGSNLVFELTPSSGGGWTESTVYTFTGGSDGGAPTALLLGDDGNFYGVTSSGGQYGYGTVFQLVPSGSGWSENVLYSFHNQSDGANPFALVRDASDNLFGLAYYGEQPNYPQSTVFMLSPSTGKWIFTTLVSSGGHSADRYASLILDVAGNLYVSGAGDDGGCIGGPDDVFGYVLKGVPGSNGWQWSTPVYFWDQTFDARGTLALDALGNLYGTTNSCGQYNNGTIWQLSP
jgi:uncharacterized repeat protein (TIGR03803 family)